MTALPSGANTQYTTFRAVLDFRGELAI